jgi:hypothetical protein
LARRLPPVALYDALSQRPRTVPPKAGSVPAEQRRAA